MNTKKILGVVAVLALVAVAMVGAGAATDPSVSGTTATVYEAGQIQTVVDGIGVDNNTYKDITKIVLGNDISETAGINFTALDTGKKTVTLDLNGKVLTFTGTIVCDDTKPVASIYVRQGNDLTITDSIGGGKIVGKYVGTSAPSVIKVDAGTLKLEKGIIDGTERTGAATDRGLYGISVKNAGTLEVGTTSGTNDDVKITSYLACLSGNNVQGTQKVTVYCGTFKSTYTPTIDSEKQWACAVYVPTGTELTIKKGSFEAGFYSISVPYSSKNNSSLTVTIDGGNFGKPMSINNVEALGETGNTVLNANTDIEVSINDAVLAGNTGLNLNIAAGKTVTVTDMTWDKAKNYIYTAGNGANVNTTTASMTFASGKTSGQSVAETATEATAVTGGNTVVDATVPMKYAVYIPSGVTLGSTAVTAEYKVVITSPVVGTDARNVKLYYTKSANDFNVKIAGWTDAIGDAGKMGYTVMNDSTAINTTDPIVIEPVTGTYDTATLTYSSVTTTGKKAGSYSDTLTFTVKVE